MIKAKERGESGSYIMRDTETGELIRGIGKPPTAIVGRYEGRSGSMRRSRKGAPRRMPNGRRYYAQPYEVYELIMY